MAEKIRQLIRKHSGLIIYAVLGVLTTVVNFLVYFPLLNIFCIPATIANVVAWAVAVVFAFLTNKPFAFKSLDWSWRVTMPEFVRFVACRVGSGLLETLFIMVTVDLLQWNGNLMKLLISVAVVIANYVTSKLLVFKQ